MICSIVIRKLKLKWGDYMWLSGGADKKAIEDIVDELERKKREKREKAERKIAKAKSKRRREKVIKQILLTLGLGLFSYGLLSLGITFKTPAYWFLILGLAFYVTFSD